MTIHISLATLFLLVTLLSFQNVHSYHQSSKVLTDSIKLRLTSGNFDGYRQTATKTGAYDIAASSKTIMPCIILVNPFLDQNVGSVSRAMLNFGLTELRVVDPRCDILSENARALAAGSVQILENAKIFPTLKECVADLQRVMATTVRPRHMTQMVYTPSSAAKVAIAENCNDKVGIMFGTERSGLTNEDVAEADAIISIPSFKHFSSLNLAQAVNIVGFELWKQNLAISDYSPPETWLHPRYEDHTVVYVYVHEHKCIHTDRYKN